MLGDNRRLDNLGRICIPRKMRKQLNIDDTDQLEITCDGNEIRIRKKEITCVFCNCKENLIDLKGRYICKSCKNLLSNSGVEENKYSVSRLGSERVISIL